MALLRENLADSYQAAEQFRDAALALAAIPLDSGQRMLEPTYKAKIHVRIARLYLEEDDSVEAERYLVRASGNCHFASPASVSSHPYHRFDSFSA